MKSDSGNHKINFILIISVMAAYPFSIRWCSILTAILLVHWFIMMLLGKLNAPPWQWVIIMIALPIMYAVSLLYTDNLQYGFSSVERRLPMLLFPIILGTVPTWNHEKRDRFFLALYFIAMVASLACLGTAIYRWIAFDELTFYWKALSAPLDFHPGYFSFFISILVFWFAGFLAGKWKSISNTNRTASLISVMYLSAFLILLASRVQLLLFFTTAVMLFVYYVKNLTFKMRMLLLLFFALSAWMMSGTYIEHRIRNINTTSYRLDNPPKKFNELTIRMALVECSWQVIGPHWLLGVGAGDSYDELDKVYRKNGYQYGYKDRQDPHNEYLHTWVSTGAVGLLFLLSNFGLSLWLAQKRKDSLQVLFIVFFMMSCLFESMLSQQKGIVLFSVLNSLLVFHPGSNQPSFAGDLVRSDI